MMRVVSTSLPDSRALRESQSARLIAEGAAIANLASPLKTNGRGQVAYHPTPIVAPLEVLAYAHVVRVNLVNELGVHLRV